MSRRAELAVAALLVTAFAPGARAEVTHEAQQWTLLSVTGRVGLPGLEAGEKSPLLVYLELQPRLSLSRGALDRALLRAAVGWDATRLAPGLSLWLGAAWIPVRSAADTGSGLVVNEGRVFQQVLWARALGAFPVQARLRFEARVLESAPRGLDTRARLLLRAGWVLPGSGDRFGPLLWDELFVHPGGTAGAPAPGFDRNRAFAGLFFKPEPWLSLEGGYLHEGIAAGGDTVHHRTLALTAAANFM